MSESSTSELSKPKESTVIYGLSSEGFQIGSKLAAKGYQVTMIDELLGTAMELRPEYRGRLPGFCDRCLRTNHS